MEQIIVFARYSAILISIVLILTYILCFITAFFRVYVVLHTYLDEKRIVINKVLEKEIIKELSSKYPYKKYLTIKIDVINELENAILWDIKQGYGKEINDNRI